jgi:tRNA(fMet)-specific endonuclease VapC
MYLLDTDIIIYSLKAHKMVRRNLQRHLHDPIKISAATLMELYYGAYKSKQVANNLAKIKTIESALEIIPVNREMVEIFGVLKSDLEKVGKPLDDFDLILAATAMSHNLTLITNNEKHFGRIHGLKMENWSRA